MNTATNAHGYRSVSLASKEVRAGKERLRLAMGRLSRAEDALFTPWTPDTDVAAVDAEYAAACREVENETRRSRR